MRYRRFLVGISCLSAIAVASAAEPTLSEKARQKFQSLLPEVRLTESDLKLPRGWELPMTIPMVERMFDYPLQVSTTGSLLLTNIENAKSSADLFESASALLLEKKPASLPVKPKQTPSLPENIPTSFREPLKQVADAMAEAQALVDRAVDSVSRETRIDFLGMHEWPANNEAKIVQEISGVRIKRKYEAMEPFLDHDMLRAGSILFKALDRVLPLLAKIPDVDKKPFRWNAPFGTVLVRGTSDDVYQKKDLEGVALLIDLGGANIYKTVVAAAQEKQLRVAIDFGSDVTIANTDARQGNAGSGIFGIGILAFPNPAGVKQLTTDSYSQGCGIGGVGALLINGPAKLTAHRFVQGTGIFGVGLLSAKGGQDSFYSANRTGQGSALVRGVGVFVHEGDNAVIEGGLVQPDPREPLGSVSMCQGVGFGHRAYSGGGVGIAHVSGNNLTVKGSYFSQGCGYWHSMGLFKLRGSSSNLQARRYDQGSGVHYAFGHFEVSGNKNTIMNWGVGPAYGWDHSVGSALFEGDDNTVHVDWGAATASIGSYSFGYFRTNRTRFKLGNFGNNHFSRNEFSTSLQAIDGQGNELQGLGESAIAPAERPLHLMSAPYGIIELAGTRLTHDAQITAPVWPELQRKAWVERATIDLQAQIQQAPGKAPLEEINDLLDVASAFSVDKESPRQATRQLLALPDEKAKLLVGLIEPAAVDQLIRLQQLIPAYGPVTGPLLLENLQSLSGQKQAIVISLLRMHRPSAAVPGLLSFFEKNEKSRLRGSVIRTFGTLLNRAADDEPGLRRLMEWTIEYLKTSNASKKQELRKPFEGLRLAEAFGLLSFACDMGTDERLHFFNFAPDDLNETIGAKGADGFFQIIDSQKETVRKNLGSELDFLKENEQRVRDAAATLLKSTSSAETSAAIVTLGQIGNAADAPMLLRFLNHKDALPRESASVALGRIGKPALKSLTDLAGSTSVATRRQAILSTAYAATDSFAPLLQLGLKDTEASVRLLSLSVLRVLPPSFDSKRKSLTGNARKKGMQDVQLDVRLSAELLQP